LVSSPHHQTPAGVDEPIRVGFVLHVMQVAGAEMLVAEIMERLGDRIDPTVICLDGIGALGDTMQARGYRVVALGRRPGIDWRVVRRMAAVIRERRIEVLHAHQYTPFFYGALGARLARAGTKVVFTEHGRHWPDVVSGRRRLINRLLLARLAHKMTGVSAFSVKGLVQSDGFPEARMEIVENGIDLAKYGRAGDRDGLRRRLGLDPSRRYVTAVARFHPVKDHRTLVDSFGRIATTMPDVDLLLVGDGPLRADLEQQVRTLGLAGRVRFLGVRPDIADILAASDVFALASLSEAASITVLEAMATELPVVVTDVGGNPEMVRDQVDGLLTPRGDAGAMAEALRRVLADEAFARRLGQSARQRVADAYQLRRTIDRYGSMYRTLARAAA
jgi:glycosyltransferase involved in cell wall biosynthesis